MSGFSKINNPTTEIISNSLFDRIGSKAISDWVWLELRNSGDNKKVLSTRSALIRKDGMVVDMDGGSPVYFTNMEAGNYVVL